MSGWERDVDFAMVQLTVEKYAAQTGISPDTLTFAVERDHLLDMVVARLVRRVATLPADDTLQVPATWVDALRLAEHRRSPIMRWLNRRWPIRYKTYRAVEALPNVPLPDKYRGPVKIAYWRDESR